MDLQGRRVKIHREEMESLLNLKSKFDREEAVSSYAAQYQKLGWVFKALNPQDGTYLGLDAGSDPETWVNPWWEPGLPGPEINLEVRTGKESRLMVLEVARGEGEALLDHYGPWQAQCVAILGGSRERHFFAWQPSPLFDSASRAEAAEFRWYGENQVILVPPSMEPDSLESWEWLRPPWETPPQYPGQSVTDFLQRCLTREPQPWPVSLSWQEVYCLVSRYDPLLHAVAASHPSAQTYYQGILAAAATAGLKAPEVLLSLLWHAPGGDAPQYPESLGYLEKLVAAAQDCPNRAASPEHNSWQLVMDESRSRKRASSVGHTGPARFVRRKRFLSSQPREAFRTPFSCRRNGED